MHVVPYFKMASCSDGTSNRERRILRSDELLHLPFKAENSKFLFTNDSKLQSTAPSKIFKVESSSVLRQVKDFLPKMKLAEEALEKELCVKSTSELDIENVADGLPYIEMNLALMEAEGYSSEDSLEETVDGESGDSDEVQTQEISLGHVTETNFVISKTLEGHVKPVIEEMPTDKRNGAKKGKSRTASKKVTRKRKQR